MQEPDVGWHQADAHGDPDLGHHRVLAVAQKGLDFEVLLDSLEEQFDLPARLVDLSDRAGRQAEVVG